MDNAGGKVTFYASLTAPRSDRGNGFRLRYVAVDRSQGEGFCSNSWDISVKGEVGRIDLSWKPPAKQSKSGYTYLVVYKSSARDVRTDLVRSTSVAIDNLDPSTEYSIQVIAIPLTNEQNSAIYSCSKRVRTRKEQARVTFGKSASEGYVQVYHGGQWTRVCDNYWWDRNDANVACRSMGLVAAKYAMVFYPKIVKKNQQILLGNTLNRVWLSALLCTGREKSLLHCPNVGGPFKWPRNCYNDAGLVCETPFAPTTAPTTAPSTAPSTALSTAPTTAPSTAPTTALSGKLRLIGGKFPNEGHLEILYGDSWGAICGIGWDIRDASVACRELGLAPATFASNTVLFGYINPTNNKIGGLKCTGSEKRLTDCPRSSWVNLRKCYSPAVAVCGHPNVTSFTMTGLTDMITSPGFPKSLDQANYEWTLEPTISNASILLCIEQLNIYRDSRFPGKVNVSVIDANGKELYRIDRGSVYGRLHVLIENNPSKVVFQSPYTFEYNTQTKGFKMRYFVFDESCRGNWNISIQHDSGNINISWSLREPKSSQFKYALVYYPSAKDIKSYATRSNTHNLDFLEPNTEFTIRLFAFVPGKTNSYFCTRRVRTDKVKWRLTGGKVKNEGLAEVYYKREWGQLCSWYRWSKRESEVLCRSLGLPKPTAAIKHKRIPNVKSWMYYFTCSGNENNLQECPHSKWGGYLTCPTVPKVVCGGPKVERHNITDQAGFIKSLGYPRYMIQAHYEWMLLPPHSNSRLFIEFEDFDLKRDNGQSQLIMENNQGRTISRTKRLVIRKLPVNITYLSSFTPENGGRGMRMRYVFIDDSCSSNWTVRVNSGIGRLDVSWTPLSKDSDYKYVVLYRRGTARQYNFIVAHSHGSATIDYLPPYNKYEVTVLALHKNDTVDKYCTKYVRTKPETFRIGGGQIPTEGRVEIYHRNKWGVVCGSNWDMNNAKVACREAGFPAPTAAYGVGANPFETKRRQPIVLRALECFGYETSLRKCPIKKNPDYRCKTAGPAGVVCGPPKECKTVLKKTKGTIRSERYFSLRKMDCQWDITAPSKTSLIVLSLRKIDFNVFFSCGTSSLSFIDSRGNVADKICGNVPSKIVLIGFAKIRLVSHRFFRDLKMKLDYHVSNDKVQDIAEAPNWNITASSRSSGRIKVKFPNYKPTDEEKSQKLYRVVKYVVVCVALKDGYITTRDSYSYNGDPEALFSNLKYGEYTVYVLAYLGDSRNTPLTNWKKDARRSRSVTLKTKQGLPLRAPPNVTATTTSDTSILVTWDPIPKEFVDGIVGGYKVYKDYISPYRGKVTDTWGDTIYGRNNTSYKLTMLFSNTKYTFQVRAYTDSIRKLGPKSAKVSTTTGFKVRITERYAHFEESTDALYPSNIHKIFVLGPWDRFDEVLIVFETFDLENSYKCSNDYVKVTDYYGKEFGGKFCGKKSMFAVSAMTKRAGRAHVTFHSNAAVQKSGFSAFYKVIDKRLTTKSSVWNLQVQNTTRTEAILSWTIPDGNVSDVTILFKESSVQYVWQAVSATPLDNSVILKGLVPVKQYDLRLVGSIFGVIQESRLISFTTKSGAKLEERPK